MNLDPLEKNLESSYETRFEVRALAGLHSDIETLTLSHSLSCIGVIVIGPECSEPGFH